MGKGRFNGDSVGARVARPQRLTLDANSGARGRRLPACLDRETWAALWTGRSDKTTGAQEDELLTDGAGHGTAKHRGVSHLSMSRETAIRQQTPWKMVVVAVTKDTHFLQLWYTMSKQGMFALTPKHTMVSARLNVGESAENLHGSGDPEKATIGVLAYPK